MANRKTTQYWEENKPVYPLCLCYSQDKGLYTKRFTENEDSKELLYRPQGYVGFVNDRLTIPEQEVEIEIQSNFGYSSASYLRATFKRGNQYVLDFDLSELYILNNCSVKTFDVPLYDWDRLFSKLVEAYMESSVKAYTTPSIAYLEELSAMLDKNEIVIKGNLEEKKSTQWKGDFLIELFAGKKIRDLLRGFEIAGTSDQIVIKHTLSLCTKYIRKVKLLDLDFSDSRVLQISETMMLIHKFMCENKAGKEYLSMLLDKEL